MLKIIPALVAFMLALSHAPAFGAVQEVPLTAGEKIRVSWILSRGRMIYRYDRAAWVASDALAEKFKADEAMSAIKGWIVQPDGKRETVTFYGLKNGEPVSVFVAELADEKVTSVSKAAPDAQLTEIQLRLIKAVERARKEATERNLLLCAEGKRFNTVAIPTASFEGEIEVYLLTPQTRTGYLPIGGHHRVSVTKDGSVTTRSYTNGCLEMGPTSPTSVLTVSHVLDPMPTEIHVFTSLTGHQPMIVLIPEDRTVWPIENGQILKAKLD